MTRLLPIPKRWREIIAADPTSELAIKYARTQRRIDAYNADETKQIERKQRSRIGTWMKAKIEKSVGGIPCGGCSRTLILLNLATAAEVRLHREKIIARIEKNSKTSTMSWWARVMAFADDIGTDGTITRFMIGRWLDDACNAEDADPLLVHNSDPSIGGVDSLAAG